jgi:mono/diheme cytochrome c family protein
LTNNAAPFTTIVGLSTVEAVGAVIAVLAIGGFVVYAIINFFASRTEVGSEIELAPNRKPYVSDDELETTKLNRTLLMAGLLLVIIAVGLPLYWLAEPGRQEGAAEAGEQTFISRGLDLYEEDSDCAACHGPEGSGGTAPHTLFDDDDEFVANVAWKAPALDTALLRFSEEEVAEIIEFGRPGTPMAGWGAGGDGPLTEQQIDNLIAYFRSIQKTPDEAQRDAEIQLAQQLDLIEPGEADEAVIDEALEEIDYSDPETGQELFNLGDAPVLDGGAYSCARCHTDGWSLDLEAIEPEDADVEPFVDFEDGSGTYGPPLSDLIPRQFATVDELAEFIGEGTELGQGYGRQGQGSGMMPGFGSNPNTEVPGDGMMTHEMLCSVALYASTLTGGDTPAEEPALILDDDPEAFCAGILE